MYSVKKQEGVIPIVLDAAARPSSKISEFFGDTLINEPTPSPERRKILRKRHRRPHHATAEPFTAPQRKDLRPRSPSNILIQSCGLLRFTWPTSLGLLSLILFLLPPPYRFHGLTTLTTALFITDVVLFILFALLMLCCSLVHSKCCTRPRQLCHELTSNAAKLGSLAYWPMAWLTLVAFAVFLAGYGDDRLQAEHWSGKGNADGGGEKELRKRVLTMIAYVMWWVGVVWMTGTMVFVMGVLMGLVGGQSERWVLRKGLDGGREEADEVRVALPGCMLTSAFGMGLLALVGGLLVSVLVRLGTLSVGMATPVLVLSLCVEGVALFTTLFLFAVLQQEMVQVEGWASVHLIKISLWMMGSASVCAAAVQMLGRAVEDVSAILGDDDTQRSSSGNLFDTPATAQVAHVVCTLLALLLLGLAALWLIVSLVAFVSFAIHRRLSWKGQCSDTVIPVAALALSTVQFKSELNSSFFGIVTCVLVMAAAASLLVNLVLCMKQLVSTTFMASLEQE
ncbi:voltage-dependent anion channel [Neurospora hispaniola]|uniref:Voltage-dependent anion channel n=1 Tax=Neurospora hispaniola TaxID=588809 RepID=A0AAJ0MW28_9PEZI|nr:voltage-dependent anion channel [Neurospora hispaniola]